MAEQTNPSLKDILQLGDEDWAECNARLAARLEQIAEAELQCQAAIDWNNIYLGQTAIASMEGEQ